MEEETGQADLSSMEQKTSQTTDKAEMNKKPTSGKEIQPDTEEKVNPGRLFSPFFNEYLPSNSINLSKIRINFLTIFTKSLNIIQLHKSQMTKSRIFIIFLFIH